MQEFKSDRKYGYKLGLRDGFNQGKIQGKKICADKMLKLGFDLEIIKKITGLSITDITINYNKK